MNAYLTPVFTASYYLLLLPLLTLVRWTLIIVAPLYFALQFVLLPILHLGRFSLHVVLLPLTLLAKLETVYIYVGVASVIGILAGCMLHVSTRVLKSMFGLENTCTKSPLVRSAADYRAERRRRRKRVPVAVPKPVEPLELHVPRENRMSKQRSLWSQPILEEDDSESC
ncbi:uncharacterized protein J3D65DRAFT_637124 [Phyllosticta citribraziliensis]|uniref:Uncharacterized protein n=1 Tax=Phyllosticta citribraziliensis TaxID=989973 RepID=A0ABR1L7R2_9PEZI